MDSKENQPSTRQDQWEIGGLLAACFALLTALAGREKLNDMHQIAIAGFAVAVPLLVLRLWASVEHGAHPRILRTSAICALIGTLAAFVGICVLFWSLAWWAGAAFLACAVVALAVGTRMNIRAGSR
jgi:predicted outer membrane lipoprotein